MADPIQLFLIRHGIAADRGPAWPDDGKRPLTEKGLARLRREVKALAALDVAFDLVLVSPLVRARQTADVFAERMAPHPPVTVIDALAPSGTPAQVVEELGKHTRRRRIALVGHEPNLGELAARLIGSRVAIEFKKGAICRIDVEALPPSRPGRLRWFATPRILRALGK
jgi:phosphohistidine phosphatase